MNIQITINCDNAAFGDTPEVEINRILQNLAEDVRFGNLEDQKLMDSNGNCVGHFELIEEAKP